MVLRKNLRYLSDAELRRFVAAVLALKAEIGPSNISTYDGYVRWHMQAMTRATRPPDRWWEHNQAHRGPAFPPWHRQFILAFERDLQRIANDPNLGLPYWDWTQDAGDPPGAPIWTPDFLGGNGDPANNDVITNGPFSGPGWQTVEAVLDANDELQGFQAGSGLRRRFSTTLGLPTQSDVDGLMGNAIDDASPWDSTVTNTFRNDLEGWVGPGLHNLVHRWVGGSMTDGTSPNDPVFFLHHCNVDRIWALWQSKYPNSPYLPESGGPTGHNLRDPMFPWDGQTTSSVITPELMLGLGEVRYV